MKKTILLALALILAFGSVAGYAAVGDAVLGKDEEGTGDIYFNYAFSIEDTLYLNAYDSVYTYHIGDPDAVVHAWGMLPEEEEGVYDVTKFPFEADGKLYAVALMTRYDENTQFEKALLCEVGLNGGEEAASLTAIRELDWSGMLEYYDADVYPRTPDALFGMDGKLYLRTYNNSGESVLAVIDLETGEARMLDDIRNLYAAIPYRDGCLLIEQYDYSIGGNAADFMIYDPTNGSQQVLGSVAVDEYDPLNGLAYDAEGDAVYCLKSGEICPIDLKAGEVMEGVADMPLEMSGGHESIIMKGGYYVYSAYGAAVRSLDPSQRAETRMKVYDGLYSDAVNKAYYQFANTHGDVSVAITRDYSEYSRVIENMMNRDNSIDIYVMNTGTNVYDAVFNRGYMMELDGSEKLSALSERLYPGIRDALTSSGHLVAIPVQTYSWTIAVNEQALEKIGLKLSDVPTNWLDFLDFMKELPTHMGSDSGVTLFYADMTAESVRSDLFYRIFDDYQKYVNATDSSIGYNTDLMRSLIEKLDSIDFTAFGYPHEDPEEEEGGEGYGEAMMYMGDEEKPQLFETGTGCSFGNFYSDYTPILMSMDAQSPAYLVLDLGVAFINPFTKNGDMALEFIEQLAEALPETVMYSIDPSLNEPVRGAYYESNKEELENMLIDAQAEYEAADAVDKQAMEEYVREVESNIEWNENSSWDIAPSDIEWYRSHDDYVVASSVNWLYNDDSGEAAELIEQFLQGKIDMNQMLTSIDKKVQMMMMEGN